MRLLSDKLHLQYMRKTYLQYFEITLLTLQNGKVAYYDLHVTFLTTHCGYLLTEKKNKMK